MGRLKKYTSDADKQAAYRSRLESTRAIVDRASLDSLHERLERLQVAINSAAKRGDSMALRCRAGSIDTLLDNLTAVFSEES